MEKRYPEVIYKYRDWNNSYHQNLLTNNELYTPSISQINDPFDCLINFDYSDLERGDLTLRSAEILFKEFGNELEKLGYDQLSLANIKDKEDLLKIISLKKKFDKKIIQNRKKHLGVISFSKRWDSILMWSHYSNCHTGFCVGFKTEKLIHSGYFNNGLKVHYNQNYPKVNPFDTDLEKIVHVFYNKSKDWEYEQEYRMTKLFGYHSDEAEFEKQKLYHFDDNFVSEVVIGLRTTDRSKEEILQICKEKNISLYQIEDVPYKFKLTRSEIFKALD